MYMYMYMYQIFYLSAFFLHFIFTFMITWMTLIPYIINQKMSTWRVRLGIDSRAKHHEVKEVFLFHFLLLLVMALFFDCLPPRDDSPAFRPCITFHIHVNILANFAQHLDFDDARAEVDEVAESVMISESSIISKDLVVGQIRRIRGVEGEI